MNKGKINFYTAVALIVGTVMGAGVLGIPYIISESGVFPNIISIVLVGLFSLMVCLFAGEIMLRTKRTKQFTGLAKKYLGKKGEILMFVSLFFGLNGALIAYLIGIGETLSFLIGGSAFAGTITFFIFSSVLIYCGIKTIGKSELLLTFLLVATVLIISLVKLPEVNTSYFKFADYSKMFYSYGVVLFSMIGFSIIPEMEITLKNQKQNLFKAITTGMVICVLTYILFSTVMVGVYNGSVAEIATASLSGVLKILGSLVAIFAMASAYLSLSTSLRDNYFYDLRMSPRAAWLLTISVPLMIVLILKPSFIGAVAVTGAVMGSLTGILISLIFVSARKNGDEKVKHKVWGGTWLPYLAVIGFVLGIFYEILLLAGVV